MIQYLLIFFITLTIISSYLLVVRADNRYGGLWAGVAFGIAFSMITAAALYKEMQAIDEVAKFVTPYDGEMNAILTPIQPGGGIVYWQFKTPDTPKQVEEFYAKKENRVGWDVIRSFPMMFLEDEDKELKMMITINTNHMKETSITYALSKIEYEYAEE